MEEAYTWRELLGRVVNDPHERQKIADVVGVNPITLTRWAGGKSKPRQENLRPLLDTLSQFSSETSRLMALEFPEFFDSGTEVKSTLSEIAAFFYARVLRAYTTTPPILRPSTIGTLLIQQLLSQLDPFGIGIIILIVQCVQPPRERSVQSLRVIQHRTTMSNDPFPEHQTFFLGTESQMGAALSSGHPFLVQNEANLLHMFPTHHFASSKSAAAYPILLDSRAAGVLYIASQQDNYFSQEHQNLIGDFADLMTLAFEPEDYYDLGMIELSVMPAFQLQQPLLSKFQNRVTRQMLLAAQKGFPLTRLQAEQIVWQELEEELFYLAINLKVQVSDQ